MPAPRNALQRAGVDARRKRGTGDGWDTSVGRDRMFAGADRIEVVVTRQPDASRMSNAEERRPDVPVCIQARIDREMRTCQGTVHMAAVQLPETAPAPFKVTEMQPDP